MKLVVTIDRAGVIYQPSLTSDVAVLLYMTPAAAKNVMEKAAEFTCKRCAIIGLADQLQDGMCKENFGCRLDVDTDVFDLVGDSKAVAYKGIFVRLWNTVRKRLIATDANEVENVTG